MADDTLNLEVVLSARTDNVKQSERSLSLLQDVVDALGRSGQITDKELRTLSSSLNRLSNQKAPTSKWIDGFAKLRTEIRKTSDELSKVAQTHVLRGGQQPLNAAASGMTLAEAKQIKAVQEASSVDAYKSADRVLQIEKQRQSAQKDLIAGQKSLSAAKREESRAEMSSLDAAKDRLAVARQELQAAQAQKGGLSRGADTPERIKARADNLEREAKARLNVLSAQREVAREQDRLATSTGNADRALNQQRSNLPRLRYALHDISTQLFVIGGAMTAFSLLSFKAAIDYEKAFAGVIRTNDDLRTSQVAASRMFSQFMDLAGEIPTTFADLSEIGQLAGQLNIPTRALAGFTEAVAMFSATTGESIDTTATAFGRLDALLPGVQGNFQALGSSILNVGINSVATEGEIIKITTQLAGIGSQAGLTYDQLVGLSGALASVGVQPELARGTITRLFGQISRSVTLGGESLESFGKIAGSTGDEFARKWASAPMEAVVDILQGIKSRGGEAEAALREVGITSVRDVPAILRLAQTVDSILVPALGDAADGASQATQLAENYGVISETVAAKLQILVNNFQSLAAVIGDVSGPLGGALDALNGILTWARDMLKNPVTSFFAQTLLVMTALGGGALLLMAAVTRLSAGFLAFRTVMIDTGVAATGLRASLMSLVGSIAGVDAASMKAGGSLGRLGTAMKGASVATAVLIAIPAINWLNDLAKEAQGASVDVDTLAKSLSLVDTGISDATSGKITETLNKSIESIGASVKGVDVWEAVFAPKSIENGFRRTMASVESEYDVGLDRLTQKTSSWMTANPWNNGENTWFAGFLDPTIAEIDKFEEAWIQAWESASSETQKQEILNFLSQMQEGLSPEQIEAFRYNLRDFYDVVGDGVDLKKLDAEATEAQAQSYEELQSTLMQIVDDVFSAVNAQLALSDAMKTLGGDYVNLGAAAAFSGKSMQAVIKNIVENSGSSATAAANLQVLYDFILKNTNATASEMIFLANTIALVQQQAGSTVAAPTLKLPDFKAFNTGAARATRSISRVGGSARKAQKEIRTLTDYSNDLAKVWGRAFEIRFGGLQALDDIRSSFISIREAADDAARRIRDLNNDISGLSADIDIQEHFLSIAIEYGNTKRAAAIEADLAKKRAELSDKTAELQDEQAAASKTLTGTSKAAIENRQEILNLLSQYQDYLQALAASGVSQGQLAAKADQLRRDFIAQATALGFSRDELKKYEVTFTEISRAISAVPFKVTTDLSSLNPATLAIREFVDEANAKLNTLGSGVGGALGGALDDAIPEANEGGLDLGDATTKAFNEKLALAKQLENDLRAGKISSRQAADQLGIGVGGQVNSGFGKETKSKRSGLQLRVQDALKLDSLSRSSASSLGTSLARLLRSGISGYFNLTFGPKSQAREVIRALTGFQSGGFTGRGVASEPAGIVHKGEYVLPKTAVNQTTGMPYADALGRLMNGVQGFQGGGYAGNGSRASNGTTMVALTPGTIQAIAQATGKIITLDGQVIAESTSRQYAHQTSVGAA